MDAFILPALAIIIVVTLIWLSTKWLGKKENRALYGFGDEPPPKVAEDMSEE